MRVRFHPPLDRIFGPTKDWPIDRPTAVASFLRSLVAEEPALAPYAGFGPRDVQPYALLIWREGRVLTLQDILDPTDELEMMPMIAGG